MLLNAKDEPFAMLATTIPATIGPLWTGFFIFLISNFLLLAQCCKKKKKVKKEPAGKEKKKQQQPEQKKVSTAELIKDDQKKPATGPAVGKEEQPPKGNEGAAQGPATQQKAPALDTPQTTAAAPDVHAQTAKSEREKAPNGKNKQSDKEKKEQSLRADNKTKEEETNDSFRDFIVPENKTRPSAEDDGYKTLQEVMPPGFYKSQRTQSKTSKTKSTTTTGITELNPTSDGQTSAGVMSEPAQKFMTSSVQRRESQVNPD